ncbi:MAG: hypothetical protein NWF01_01720 [Candidatus Bathyarchaeota archaeon]|nr:hypothetical protein [Candidatus Bathyarchaeota archaeon]
MAGLSTQQIDMLKNTCIKYFKQRCQVHIDVPISDDIRWRPHVYAKNHEELILDILTTEDIPESQIEKYITIKNRFPEINIYLAIIDDVRYSYPGVIEKCSRYGIGIYIINDNQMHLMIAAKAPTIEQIRSHHNTAIAPNAPFGNILALKKCFRNCKEYLFWIEKNLPKKVFEVIYNAIKDGDITGVDQIRLLRVFDESVDERFRNEFERLRGELIDYGINIELRVICNKLTATSVHGRFIYTKDQQYQLPPLNSLLANQWDNIFRDPKIPQFEDYWKSGLDVVTKWSDIQKSAQTFLQKQKVHS